MGRYGQLETGDEPWEPGMPQFPDPRLDPRIDPTLWNPRLAVKSYVRADAGNAEANEHIRPTPVLTITVMYLCKHFVARYDALDGSNHSKKSHKPVGYVRTTLDARLLFFFLFGFFGLRLVCFLLRLLGRHWWVVLPLVLLRSHSAIQFTLTT